MGCIHATDGQFDELLAAIAKNDQWRADQMPDEAAALNVMFQAHERLKQLGWRDVLYCPRDGSEWEFCGPGSTGIHPGYRDEQGRFWVSGGGDIWPADPSLFRAVQARSATERDATVSGQGDKP